MKAKNSLFVPGMLKHEIVTTKGANKFLLIGLLCNIPFYWFIPYLSQALTVILLILYLKNRMSTNFTKPALVLSVIAVVMQMPIFWVPFVTQVSTLVVIGVIFIFSSQPKIS